MMKNNYTIEAYKKSQLSANLTKSPHEIVRHLMDNLIACMKNINEDTDFLENKSNQNDINIVEVSKNRANNVTKALTIIYSLQVSLDFEKTPEIAKSFFQIYEYCRQQIIKALTQKIKSGLEKSIKVMEEILDGWLEIGLERKNNA